MLSTEQSPANCHLNKPAWVKSWSAISDGTQDGLCRAQLCPQVHILVFSLNKALSISGWLSSTPPEHSFFSSWAAEFFTRTSLRPSKMPPQWPSTPQNYVHRQVRRLPPRRARVTFWPKLSADASTMDALKMAHSHSMSTASVWCTILAKDGIPTDIPVSSWWLVWVFSKSVRLPSLHLMQLTTRWSYIHDSDFLKKKKYIT